MSIDGTPISQADIARMEADEALHADWQRRAVRVIASGANDADDCRTLLAMLGLDGQIAVDARRGSTHKPARRRRAKAA